MVNTHRHSTLPFSRYASFTIHHSPFTIHQLYFQRLTKYHQRGRHPLSRLYSQRQFFVDLV